MSFIYGTKLATLQDDLFKAYKDNPRQPWDQNTIDKLAKNKWIKLSVKLGPNNLTVRNYCLVDLLQKKEEHITEILKLCRILAPAYLWLEGYSYWLYTEPFLAAYESSGYLSSATTRALKIFRNRVNAAFGETAYTRLGTLYPAPFGDLRNVPLAYRLQTHKIPENSKKHPVLKQLPTYHIEPKPLGFNLHTDTKKSIYTIDSGVPLTPSKKPFKWYQGYDKKYPNKISELKAMLSFKRILSIAKGFK